MTTSPGPTPRVASAMWRAAVHELTASAEGAPTAAANCRSNSFVFGPVVIQSERRVSITSEISSSPMRGGENDNNSLRMIIQLGGCQKWLKFTWLRDRLLYSLAQSEIISSGSLPANEYLVRAGSQGCGKAPRISQPAPAREAEPP